MFGTFLHINLYTRPVKLRYEDLETIKSPQCLVHFYTLAYTLDLYNYIMRT